MKSMFKDPFWLVFWITVGIFVILFTLRPGQAHAHDWFPEYCCHDRDCFEVSPIDELISTPNGYLYTPTNELYMYDDTRIQKDPTKPYGRAFVCTPNGEKLEKPHCIFPAEQGV